MKPNRAITVAVLLVASTASPTLAQDTTAASPTTAERAVEESEGDAPPDIRVRGRIHAGWDYQHLSGPDAPTAADERSSNYFLVRRSRLKVQWRPERWLKAQLQIDPIAGWNAELLKDAYVQLTPWRPLRLRVGQFKKPFSGLELRSPARLKVISRGPGNDLIVDNLNFGDRDLGLMLYGRLVESVRLDYAIGAFNGQIPDARSERDKDLVGRLRIRPIKMVSIGLSYSHKFFNPEDEDAPEHAWATGGDVRFRFFGVRLHTEVLVAENYEGTASSDPLALDVVGILSYRRRIPVSWGFALEPVFKFELLDADTDVADDEILLYTAGLNLYFGEYFRLMVDAEFSRGSRNTTVSYDADYLDSELLMVNLCLDI
jgi:hypothetical protein